MEVFNQKFIMDLSYSIMNNCSSQKYLPIVNQSCRLILYKYSSFTPHFPTGPDFHNDDSLPWGLQTYNINRTEYLDGIFCPKYTIFQCVEYDQMIRKIAFKQSGSFTVVSCIEFQFEINTKTLCKLSLYTLWLALWCLCFLYTTF